MVIYEGALYCRPLKQFITVLGECDDSFWYVCKHGLAPRKASIFVFANRDSSYIVYVYVMTEHSRNVQMVLDKACGAEYQPIIEQISYSASSFTRAMANYYPIC